MALPADPSERVRRCPRPGRSGAVGWQGRRRDGTTRRGPGAGPGGRAGLADGCADPRAGQARAAVRRCAPADRLHTVEPRPRRPGRRVGVACSTRSPRSTTTCRVVARGAWTATAAVSAGWFPQTGTGPATEEGFAHGNADLLLRMRADLEEFGAPHACWCRSADHVFYMDLAPVIDEHIAVRPGCDGADQRGDQEGGRRQRRGARPRGAGRVTGVAGQAVAPVESGTVATEIFVYRHDDRCSPRSTSCEPSWPATRRSRDGDSGLGDFGEHLLPRLSSSGEVRAVPLTGYWRDVGQPGQYLQAHRDLLAGRVDVFDHATGARSSRTGRTVPRPGSAARGPLTDCLLSPGLRRRRRGGGQRARAGGRGGEGARSSRTASCSRTCVVDRGARVRTAVIDERCESLAGSAESARRRPRRVARDERRRAGRS